MSSDRKGQDEAGRAHRVDCRLGGRRSLRRSQVFMANRSCWHHVGRCVWALAIAPSPHEPGAGSRNGAARPRPTIFPQLGERIDDRIDHRSKRRCGTSLDAGTDAKPIGRRRYFAERGSQKWQRIGPRHRVVHQARRQQLPALSASRSATPSQREGRRGVGRVGRPPYPSPRMLSRRAQRHHFGLGLMFAHQLSGSLRHRVGSGQQHRAGHMQISRSGRVPLLKPAASSAVSHCPGSAFPRNRCAGRRT